MATKWRVRLLAGVGTLACVMSSVSAAPLVVGTYQGQLKNNGAPVNGPVDIKIGIWDSLSGGTLLATVTEHDGVDVENGLFTVDFRAHPAIFDGTARFLEIAVRVPADPTNTALYTLLAPRQSVTPVPYALKAIGGGSAGHSLDASDGSPTNAVFVDADGNVGVGTTAPAADLHVRGKTPLGMVIVTPSVADSSSEILMTENTSASLGAIMRYDGTSNEWQILGQSRDAQSLPIEVGPHLTVGRDNGRVGIGTASPEAELHVFKGSAGAITANSNAPLVVESDHNAYLDILTPDANESGVLFGRPGSSAPNAAGGVIFNSDAPDGLAFRTGGNKTRMTIDADGNVGIGTNVPARHLEVQADQATARLNTNSNSFGSVLELRNTTASPSGLGFIRFMNATDTNTARGEIFYGGDNSMTFSTNAAERVRINSTGNVGIGTTTPTSRLDVAGEIHTQSGGLRFPDNTLQTTAQVQGPPGPPGPHGQACWDLNNNGIGDVGTEDRNGDGVVNVDDCQGPTGVPGTSFAVCGTGLSCATACGSAANVLGESHESGSGTPGAGCTVTSDTGSCSSITTLSDDCCVCKQP